MIISYCCYYTDIYNMQINVHDIYVCSKCALIKLFEALYHFYHPVHQKSDFFSLEIQTDERQLCTSATFHSKQMTGINTDVSIATLTCSFTE